jgi:hypothetical protein
MLRVALLFAVLVFQFKSMYFFILRLLCFCTNGTVHFSLSSNYLATFSFSKIPALSNTTPCTDHLFSPSPIPPTLAIAFLTDTSLVVIAVAIK